MPPLRGLGQTASCSAKHLPPCTESSVARLNATFYRLRQRNEPRQTFDKHLACDPPFPAGARRTLCMPPPSDFTQAQCRFVGLPAESVLRYFDFLRTALEPLPFSEVPARARRHGFSSRSVQACNPAPAREDGLPARYRRPAEFCEQHGLLCAYRLCRPTPRADCGYEAGRTVSLAFAS